ncbi:peptidoglycan-binding protein [Rhizobium sp. KVB221]|uniref:Peptidoglycan-binding protein n=1 Tax=Rhizobium setariae TaxID=2801340 RepID=A0A937CLG4_9HYPH|nr:peptidoglycan-binding protein [Rhizobium setariae]MBL0373160.1 peptidoglycan-binding protein [Rhizobium setariae]
MKLSRHFNTLMASAVSLSLAASPLGVTASYAQTVRAAEAPGDTGWQKEFQMWRAASKAGTAADYEAYIKAYPSGKFASVAQKRIDDLNGVKSAGVEQSDATATQSVEAGDAEAEKIRDLEMWRQVSKTGTKADYEKYLKAFPKGKFAKVAKTRIDTMIAKAEAPEVKPQVADAQQDVVEDDAADQQATSVQPDDTDAQMADQAGPSDDAAAQAADAAQAGNVQQAGKAQTPAAGNWEQEYALWKAASDGNTVKEYEAYLGMYPNGKFSAIAQARIVQLAAAEQPVADVAEGDEQPADQNQRLNQVAEQPEDQNRMDQAQSEPVDQNQAAQDQSDQMDEPTEGQQMAANQSDAQGQDDMGQNTQARDNIQFTEGTPEAEEQLLDREQRHEIQGRLTSLGYDTFGSDGSFGPNTRTAISNWQQENGAPVSGYLSDDQVAQIRKLSEVAYAEWLSAQPRVVEQPVVVRPRREKVVVVEERDPALDAAIAVGVLGAVVGAHKFGKFKVGKVRPGKVKVIGKFNFGKVKNVNCRKKRRC